MGLIINKVFFNILNLTSMKKNLFIFAVSALLLGCTDLEDVQESKINQQQVTL